MSPLHNRVTLRRAELCRGARRKRRVDVLALPHAAKVALDVVGDMHGEAVGTTIQVLELIRVHEPLTNGAESGLLGLCNNLRLFSRCRSPVLHLLLALQGFDLLAQFACLAEIGAKPLKVLRLNLNVWTARFTTGLSVVNDCIVVAESVAKGGLQFP